MRLLVRFAAVCALFAGPALGVRIDSGYLTQRFQDGIDAGDWLMAGAGPPGFSLAGDFRITGVPGLSPIIPAFAMGPFAQGRWGQIEGPFPLFNSGFTFFRNGNETPDSPGVFAFPFYMEGQLMAGYPQQQPPVIYFSFTVTGSGNAYVRYSETTGLPEEVTYRFFTYVPEPGLFWPAAFFLAAGLWVRSYGICGFWRSSSRLRLAPLQRNGSSSSTART